MTKRIFFIRFSLDGFLFKLIDFYLFYIRNFNHEIYFSYYFHDGFFIVLILVFYLFWIQILYLIIVILYIFTVG
ncbi:hypothetical protein B738_00460 [Photorhabdus temperata subsp. temperata M1021]|nr:hypothetical protein B738_00460 [Photorhabdus temperata subsp. temperata M1021]